MSKIFENTLSYIIGKTYVVWSFNQYYDKIIVRGQKNIPENEPVIFAPNHLNALMDALAILSLPPFRQVKVYLSRADVFNLPKPLVKFIRFTKILPAFRIRDGYENLVKNKTSFDTADDVLLHNAAICIMPEGDQGTERKIRPLVKGIFRIAFSAQQKLPEGKSISIIPVGIDLGDFIKFGKHLIINIGNPISISSYMESYCENQAVTTNKLKEKLQSDLENLTLHLNSEKYYECFITAVDLVNKDMLVKLHLENNTFNLFLARQYTAKILNHLEKTESDTIEYLDKACKMYKSGMQKIKLKTLNKKTPSFFDTLVAGFKGIVLTLLALPGIALNIIPFMLASVFPTIMKIKFKGFYSSVYYVAGIVLFPLFYIFQTCLLISIFSLPWWSFFILIPGHYYTGKFSFLLIKEIEPLLNHIRLFWVSKAHFEEVNKLRNLKQQISEILLNKTIQTN